MRRIPLFAAALLPLFFFASGCERDDSQATAAADSLTISLKSPEDAVRSLLVGLVAVQRAAAAQDKQTVRAIREKLGEIVAADIVDRALALHPPIKFIIGDDVRVGMVKNWASTTAYYAAGANFDGMFRTAQSAAVVKIVIPASGREDDALIEITCNLGADGQWRISRLEFVVDAVPLAPASRPSP